MNTRGYVHSNKSLHVFNRL